MPTFSHPDLDQSTDLAVDITKPCMMLVQHGKSPCPNAADFQVIVTCAHDHQNTVYWCASCVRSANEDDDVDCVLCFRCSLPHPCARVVVVALPLGSVE